MLRLLAPNKQQKCSLSAALLKMAIGLSLYLMPWITWADIPNKQVSPILVFVSFSMPVASLAAIVHDARQQGAHVLLQGLVDHSFKSTFARLSGVIQQAGGGGMQLDPVAFERYHITRVPTVVVLNTSGDPNDFDSVAGDIPLTAALTAIRDH